MDTVALERTPRTPLSASPVPAAIGSPSEGYDAALGNALADFGCTYKRLRGRLYAFSNAFLFQSNLLGFETKITVLWGDVVAMELCRTTSIELTLSDGEIYTFRSFQNREFVLELLKTLKASHEERDDHARPMVLSFSPNRRPALRSLTSDPIALSHMRSSLPQSPSTPILASVDDNSPSSSVVTPLRSNRRRAASESSVKNRIPSTRVSESSASIDTALYEPSAVSDAGDKSSAFIQSILDTDSADALDQSWRIALQMKHDIGVDNVGVDSLHLPCSLQQFHHYFLADGALYGLDRFQRERIGDTDLEVAPWTEDADAGVVSRILTFVHPLKPSAGMGPSEARTSRRQKLRWYGEQGLTLENTTVVEGVPAADCFFVRDHWLVEALQDRDEVRLTIRFGTHFHRRSLLRSFIEKSVTAQTTEWFSGYAQMLQEAVCDKLSETAEIKEAGGHQAELRTVVTNNQVAHLERKVYLLLFFVILLVVACVITVLLLLSMHRSIVLLKIDFAELKEELRGATASLVACDSDDMFIS